MGGVFFKKKYSREVFKKNIFKKNIFYFLKKHYHPFPIHELAGVGWCDLKKYSMHRGIKKNIFQILISKIKRVNPFIHELGKQKKYIFFLFFRYFPMAYWSKILTMLCVEHNVWNDTNLYYYLIQAIFFKNSDVLCQKISIPPPRKVFWLTPPPPLWKFQFGFVGLHMKL